MTTTLQLSRALLVSGLLSLVLSQPTTVQAQDKPPELNLQTSHQGRINAVAFSPDGRIIASAGADRTIKIWDAARGIVIRTLEGHSGQVFALTFSRDGATVISGSQDHSIVFWDVKSGRSLRMLKDDPQFWVTGVSPGFNDHSIISVSRLGDEFTNVSRLPERLGDIRVWDLTTGKFVRSFRTNGMSNSLAATQDGSLVYCVTGEIWDVRAGKLVSNEYSLGHASQAAFSPSGNLLAIVNFYGLDVWDVKRLSPVYKLHDLRDENGKHMELASVAFSPDGRLIAAGDENGWIGLWEAETGKGLGILRAHPAQVSSVAFSPDGKSLVTAGRLDNSGQEYTTIKLWEIANDHLGAARKVEADAASVTSSAASSEAPKADITAQGVPVSTLAFSPDGQLLAAGGSDSIVRIWDLQSGSLRTLEGNSREIRSLSFSPDSKKIVSATDGSQATIRLWDARTGAPVRSFDGFSPSAVAFHPDGRTIVSNGMSEVTAWDTASEAKAEMHSSHSLHEKGFVAVNPSGKLIASTSEVLKPTHPNTVGYEVDHYSISLFDRETRKEVRVLYGHLQPVRCGSFGPDRQTFVSGSEDKTLKIWDVNDGHLVRTLSGHSGAVISLAYSGTMIASASEDQTVKLWDANTGSLLRTLKALSGNVTSVVFGPEGLTVAAGARDGTIQIWSTKDGSPLLNLREFQGRQWIAYTPQGYYASSDGHANYITWRIGNAVYDADQFFEKFYMPDLFLRVFQGKLPASAAETRTVAPPPDVLIVSPRPGQVFTDPEVEVSLEVKDLGGGVDEVRLFQNGKLINPEGKTRGVMPVETEGGVRQRYKLTLVDGENVLRATGFSSDRTESKAHEITVELRAPKKVAALRLLAVGVSRYKNSGLSLTYPKADADSVVAFFKTAGSRLFREVDVTELADEKATEANILEALLSLRRRALPEDVVIVFLAGHGANAGAQWYFIPHDLSSPENESELTAHGMSSARLSQELKGFSSLKTILLVDACYAGSMLTAFRGFEDRKALALLGRSAGVHIMAASARDQHASEVAELGHGVFSYALLKGLNGEGVLRTTDKRVTVLGLMSYIRDQLPDLGKKYGIEIQDPVSYSNGMDFPVALLP